jgi:hypothetical protein
MESYVKRSIEKYQQNKHSEHIWKKKEVAMKTVEVKEV